MDLFSSTPNGHEPLAYRMRPRTLDEFVGQEHIVGRGRLLRRVIQADQLSSLIFYGPPGSGKTTLAQVIANTTKSRFITMNAVLSGVKELREAIALAKEDRDLHGRRTTLFVDEVHRWNKAQQDALLPWVENGTVILIGATTENPYFEVIPALVSRSRIFQLKGLTEADLESVARATLADAERGYGKYRVRIAEDALAHLVKIANGDARSLLNALELAVETTPERFPPEPGSEIVVTLPIAEESIQRKVVLYDKEGDYHFDTISAFIKSVRGSDPDAALYWLARMVRAGEDPHFMFRRMLILASEDVGMGDPNALRFVESAAAAFDRVGLPEGRFHLAHAALYLATAPKSNSTLGFFDALEFLDSEERSGEVPNHLRDASRDKEGFGHGEGYLYPHAFRDHWVAQQYLPAPLQGKLFYEPSDQGYEATIREAVLRRREIQSATALEPPSIEVLTFSPERSTSARWLERLASGRGAVHAAIRERIFGALTLRRHDRVLDADARSGLLLWEAARRVPEGGVWGIVSTTQEQQLLVHAMRELAQAVQPIVILASSSLAELARSSTVESLLGALGLDPALRFEAVVGRNLLTRADAQRPLLAALASLLAPGGRLSLAEVVPSMAQRLSTLFSAGRRDPGAGEGAAAGEHGAGMGTAPREHGAGDGAAAGEHGAGDGAAPREHGGLGAELAAKLSDAEERAYSDRLSPFVGWGAADLEEAARACGLADVRVECERYTESRVIGAREVEAWLRDDSTYGRALAAALSPSELSAVRSAMTERLVGREVEWESTVAFLSGRCSSR